MRKMIFTFLTFILSLPAFAEGYQVNVLSAKQTGMGHVGTGMKLGVESIYFNPAGLIYMQNTGAFSIGGAGVYSKAKYKEGGYKAQTNNPISTPFYAYFGYRVNERWATGIGLNTPYGNSLRWPNNWKGAALSQRISLKAFVLQPTVSYKIFEGLSIGGGVQIAFGNFSLSKGLVPPGFVSSIAQNPAYAQIFNQNGVTPSDFNDVIAYSAELSGNSQVRVGFSIGVMYDINEDWTVGITYRNKIVMKVKEGDGKINYASSAIETSFTEIDATRTNPLVPPLNQGNFRASLPLPGNLNVGGSWRPNDRWQVAMDLQYVFWSAYDSLTVVFNQKVVEPYNQYLPKKYRNTIIVRTGASYKFLDELDFRAGLYFDQSPVRKNYYNPETPGMNKLGLSVGSTYRPVPRLDIDFAALWVQGFGRKGSYTYTNTALQNQEVFSGNYNAYAVALSLGLTYRF